MSVISAYQRFAIYYTPPEGDLARFGAAWLGWDCAAGRAVAHPALPALPAPIEQITQTPRRYGFHATMKPPFALHTDDQPALEAAFTAFCRAHAPVTLSGLALAPLGRFLALVPTRQSPALTRLAAACVRDLDMFRAPPSPETLARHRAKGLSPEEDQNLIRWGYPFVMERFRWHMTLTSRLPKAQVPQVQTALEPLIARLCPGPLGIEALSLVGEDAQGRFHLIRRTPLGG